ncbi:MAG TPA: BatD family protein [Candidatus Acidoferrum sp.]|nr:BatD family protein [Candidatus Acidoferrum sp.]
MFLVLVLLLLSVDSPLLAQPQPAPAPAMPDPLMSLMLSQPSIDVSSTVFAAASVDPPVVRPGEDATYRVTFNALEESVNWPGKFAEPPQLQTRAGAHGQILVFGGATLQPRTTFNYHIRSSEPGRFTIPEFAVTVYGKSVTVPTALLEVVDASSASVQPAPRLILQAATTNLFVGQALRVRIECPPGAGLVSQGTIPLQIAGDGFIVDPSAFRQRFEPRLQNPSAINLPVPSYETILTPIRAGRLSAFAQGFFITRGSASLFINGAGAVNGSWSPYTLLDSDPVELQVRPLPRDGRLPGFTGAIGTFSIDTPELATNMVRVGDPVRLRVKVHGDGNLARLVAPPPPRNRDWQVFDSPADSTPPQIVQAQGYATFEFTLIPLTPATLATPPIPFSFFDPSALAYNDLTIQPVPIQILPGAAPGDLKALAQANAVSPPPEREPMLSGLAAGPGAAAASLTPFQLRPWYPAVQLAPAGAFLGLWSWDRRRRFLEQHPEVVRRRRARRALHRARRALETAALAGDTGRFAGLGVSALRIACAPHYPAEPRALVGADVLGLLSESERAGRAGEVVRRFFSVTDAERFSVEPLAPGELLALQPDLEAVLQDLEDRL